MEESCVPESLSSCHSVSDVSYYVRNRVELCIQNYMSLERTAKYLEKNHQIRKTATHLVWEQLRKENPDFFVQFDLRCKMVLQMRMYNDMLTKQAVEMFENGLLDICDASPSVKTLLRQQHPERVHLLETLASKRELCSASLAMPNENVAQSQNPYDHQDQVPNVASFAMPNPNVPSVAQWQMPSEQLNQQLLCASSLPLPYANGPSVTQLPIPCDQQDQPHPCSLPTHNNLTGNSLGAPTFEPSDIDEWLLLTGHEFKPLGALPPLPPADTNPWSSSDYISYTVTMPEQDLSTFELGGNIGDNGPSFLDPMDTDEQQQHFNGQQYQPHWQQHQQNVQEQRRNEDIIDEYLRNNVDITIVDQQQARGVEQGQHPESEALNNPQQNVPVETLQREGNNDNEFCNNFEQKQSKRMCTSFDQQQAGRVKHHCSESEALYNPK